MSVLDKLFRIDQRAFKKIKKKAVKVLDYEEEMKKLSDEELKAKTQYFKDQIQNNGKTVDDILPEAFAVCREAAKRVIGQFPYPVQVFGATVLNEGDVAEMKTGEGKTLTATMAVYLNALEGKGVHVVTVNEYLASRDAEWMGQIYRFLGLTVGVNLREKDTAGKQEAYKCDITYTTNSELGFDYLRDNMATRPQDRVLRGLHFAIVDEADSILIDESRTPLIISGGSGITANSYVTADRFVKSLRKDKDFTYDIKKKSCTLTDKGVDKVEAAFGIENLYDPQYSDLVHRIHQALKANFTMQKDVEYMVSNDEILLIDSFTGRVLQGREYSDGLQQAIQAKEHVTIKPETITLATITYQNFFRLYDKLSGMTGTAKTEEEEFRKIYNMRVIQIPTNRPVQRIDDVDLVFGNSNARFKALVEEVKKRHATGQPILIGTASVEKSEVVDKLLTEAGLPHDVLNAKNHAREAAIIAEAGKKGAITIATNMAGRGTDIKIDDEVKKLGGLAVLGTERHESRRIDNQLRGRSGRQGDPGYSRFFVSLDDELMQRFGSDSLQRLFGKMGDEPLESSMVTKAITTAQKKVEGQNFDTRKNLLDYDDVLRQQREIMYKQRDTILFSDSIFDSIQKYFERAAEGLVSESIVEIDQEKVVDETKLIKLVEPKYLAPGTINPTDFHQIPADEATDFLATIMYKIYLKKRKGWSDDVANYVEKTVTLQQVDKNWTKHIDTMSKLRESIYLRSYANSNPLQAYTNEGYDLFNKMALTISDEVVNNLLHVQVRVTTQPQQPAPEAQPAADAEEVKEVRETPTEEPKQEEVKEENKEQN
ncbi:MAG TPA: preprotein translocase subunit SecA [Firmicutes bacterium]|nr:preprotein translocase subunit SecA [Bacillota bacterium]